MNNKTNKQPSVITDCVKRPEGLTPLIFWEWMAQTPMGTGRRIGNRISQVDGSIFHWFAIESGPNGIREITHQYAGGLAAQLQPETSFKDIIG